LRKVNYLRPVLLNRLFN